MKNMQNLRRGINTFSKHCSCYNCYNIKFGTANISNLYNIKKGKANFRAFLFFFLSCD